jgi:hypothetical protein
MMTGKRLQVNKRTAVITHVACVQPGIWILLLYKAIIRVGRNEPFQTEFIGSKSFFMNNFCRILTMVY